MHTFLNTAIITFKKLSLYTIALQSVSHKRAPPLLLFWITRDTVTHQPIFNYFWYTTFWRNLTAECYKLTHLTYKLLPHYLGKHKSNFSTLLLKEFNTEQFSKSSNIPEIFTVLKRWLVHITASVQSELIQNLQPECSPSPKQMLL